MNRKSPMSKEGLIKMNVKLVKYVSCVFGQIFNRDIFGRFA